MKERKRLPYFPLFIDDWMQSSGVCDCSDATRGIYIDLLCVLFKEKVRGAYSLHSKEMRWHYSRSKTQLALAKPTVSERLPYFVDFLVKPLRSTRSAILKALQELLYHDMIVIVGDVLIQPRLYRDYGGKLLDEGGEDERLALPDISEARAVAAEDNKVNKKNNKKGAKNGTKKTSEKDAEKTQEKSRARASRTGARTPNGSESENNNIIKEDNNEDSIETNKREIEKNADAKLDDAPQTSVNDASAPTDKHDDKHADKHDDASAKRVVTIDGKPLTEDDNAGDNGFAEFWDLYDKKVNMIEAQAYWGVLSQQDRDAIMQYLPRYKLAQPTKRFRKNPVTFLRMRAWEDEIIREQEVAPPQRSQQRPGAMKQGVQVTEVKPGQYDEDW